MCPDCIPVNRLARQWSVRPKFVYDLVRSRKLATHNHGERATITRESVQECMWIVAMRKIQAEDNEAA